jgi:hypothetical protein
VERTDHELETRGNARAGARAIAGPRRRITARRRASTGLPAQRWTAAEVTPRRRRAIDPRAAEARAALEPR